MQAEALIQHALAVKDLRVESVRIESEGIVATVALSTNRPVCSGCGHRVAQLYDRRVRRWRALDLCGKKLQLEGVIRRLSCPRCGVKTEMVPWAEPDARHARDFEDHTAYLAQKCDKTTVAELMRVGWRTVGSILESVVQRRSPKDRLDGLRRLGIDELSYRKHHEYLTVVTDLDRHKVVWLGKDKSRATVQRFFDELGAERTARLTTVAMDMCGAFISTVGERAPAARIVFDRFHIQELLNFALDEVRRDEVNATKRGTTEAKALKRTRWSLVRNNWNLTALDRERLSLVQKRNRRLYRAYLLKESLVALLESRDVGAARKKLGEWFTWAKRSALAPFQKLAKTLARYRDGILAYVETRLSNGPTEALNGKTRTITRRSYGFHRPESLMALIYLCCSGLKLQPVHS